MSSNLTLGAVQVLDNSVSSINLALQELLNRIDDIKGLRGRTELWDRAQVSAPTVSTDAVDLGSLTGRESLFHLTFFSGGAAGLVAYQPGTSYVEISSLLRQQINFSAPTSLQGRVVASGFGTQSGSGKGVALTDDSGTTLCEVTWDGATESVRVGDFTTITLAADTLSQLRVKGSAAGESLVLRHVAVEFKLDAGSSVDL